MLDNLGSALRGGVPITALYGGLCGIFYVLISTNVSRVRGQVKIFLENDKVIPESLFRAQRAHGNASEYLPLGLLFLLALELSGGGSTLLHVFGGVLLLARISHFVGVVSRNVALSIPGAALTWLTLLAESIYLLVLRFR